MNEVFHDFQVHHLYLCALVIFICFATILIAMTIDLIAGIQGEGTACCTNVNRVEEDVRQGEEVFSDIRYCFAYGRSYVCYLSLPYILHRMDGVSAFVRVQEHSGEGIREGRDT